MISTLKKSEPVAPSLVSGTALPFSEQSTIPIYSHYDLLTALFWVWDAFDRAQMGMFLVYDTALSAMNNSILKGDKITVGTRLLEWNSGSTPILKAFTGEPIFISEKYIDFSNPFNSVIVRVYLFETHSCIESTKQIMYENEAFMVPNTYEQFIKEFGDKP